MEVGRGSKNDLLDVRMQKNIPDTKKGLMDDIRPRKRNLRVRQNNTNAKAVPSDLLPDTDITEHGRDGRTLRHFVRGISHVVNVRIKVRDRKI